MKIIDGQRYATVTETGIYGFFGPYRFLSNFHQAPVHLDGLIYPSSENAYMAQKTNDMELRKKFSLLNPKDAKAFGRVIPLIEDWDNKRVDAMKKVLKAKFQNADLASRLKATSDLYLEETNDWNPWFKKCKQHFIPMTS